MWQDTLTRVTTGSDSSNTGTGSSSPWYIPCTEDRRGRATGINIILRPTRKIIEYQERHCWQNYNNCNYQSQVTGHDLTILTGVSLCDSRQWNIILLVHVADTRRYHHRFLRWQIWAHYDKITGDPAETPPDPGVCPDKFAFRSSGRITIHNYTSILVENLIISWLWKQC